MTIPFVKANPSDEVKDTDWVREAFLLSQGDIDSTDRFWCTYTSTDNNFSDTRLGGSLVINPYPQFTHFADPCLSSVNKAHNPTNAGKMDTVHSIRDEWGTGHYYDEAFFENMQMIHMQFGHIRFKGVLSFFLGMYDGQAGLLARSGRTGFTYWLGKTLMTLVTLPLQVYCLAGQAANFILARPTSQYAYLSPSMGTFWNRATMICNAFTVNMRIAPPLWANSPIADSTGDMDEIRKSDDDDAEYREYAYRKTGGIFRQNGGIDLYLVANGPQRIANQYRKKIQEISETASSKSDYRAKLLKLKNEDKVADPGGIPLRTYLEKFHNSVFGNMANIDINDIPSDMANEDISTATAAPAATEQQVDENGQPVATESSQPFKIVDNTAEAGMVAKWVRKADDTWERIKGWAAEGSTYLAADLDYGSQYVTMRVDDTGPVSESFTSSTRESEIASTLNGVSKEFRSKSFSFAGGNTGIAIVDAAKTGLSNFITGGLDAIHLSGLYALMGASYVDIPHHWEDSVANFPTLSYSCDCIPASGSDLARLISMYVPASIMLAAALPMSTGGATYTAPYYCQVYDRGRNMIRLGMIDSLSLEWGITNLPFNNEFKPLSLRMTWSIKDMSNVFHAPADAGFNVLKPWQGVITDDTKYTDYVAMRSSVTMGDMLFPQRKLRLRMTKRAMDYNSYFSRSHFSNAIANSKPVYILAGLFGDAHRVNLKI